MLFFELFTSALLLPLLGPAVAVAALLLASGRRHRAAFGLGLGLALLLPVFVVAQCLLSVASWCLSPLAEATARPPFAPWYAELLLAPACYLCLRVLRCLRGPQLWRRLLPGMGQLGLFAGVAVLNLGYRHGVAAARFGPPSGAAELLRHLLSPLALGCYVLLVLYGLQALDSYQRATTVGVFRRPAQGPQRLLALALLGVGLALGLVALDAWFGPFAYSETWYAFGVRVGLVFGLTVVGLQAGRRPARPLPQLRLGVAVGAPRRPVEALTPAAPVATRPAELPPELRPWREKLLALMAAERPWLEPELTLGELAQRLQTHPAQLSKIINLGCGQSFSDFVNGYRVAEARRKLADPRFAHYSLVGVALESGFNSKSTFNRVFKKVTGQAPGELARAQGIRQDVPTNESEALG